MNASGILPCPFCGGGNLKVDICLAAVLCVDCTATGPSLLREIDPEGFASTDAIVTVWNNRAPSPSEETVIKVHMALQQKKQIEVAAAREGLGSSTWLLRAGLIELDRLDSEALDGDIT